MTTPLRPTKVGRSWVRTSDQTAWPRAGHDEDDSLSHLVRYGSTDRVMARRYEIASALEAWRLIVHMPRRERERVIRMLREAEEMRETELERERGTK